VLGAHFEVGISHGGQAAAVKPRVHGNELTPVLVVDVGRRDVFVLLRNQLRKKERKGEGQKGRRTERAKDRKGEEKNTKIR